MAKRRNAKKEKAARNKINARKFRKPSSRYSKRGRRWSSYGNNNEGTDKKSSENNSDQSTSSETTSGTDKTVN